DLAIGHAGPHLVELGQRCTALGLYWRFGGRGCLRRLAIIGGADEDHGKKGDRRERGVPAPVEQQLSVYRRGFIALGPGSNRPGRRRWWVGRVATTEGFCLCH